MKFKNGSKANMIHSEKDTVVRSRRVKMNWWHYTYETYNEPDELDEILSELINKESEEV